MQVIVAQSAGFCWGVRRAVEKAREAARHDGSTVYTDGPLIHNEDMMRRLNEEGVVEAEDPQTLAGGTLIVRAHGIPPERRERLRRLPLRLVDATCPDVSRIQGLVRRHTRRGEDILIYGDPGHAEVTGLLGFAGGRGHVVTSPADIAALPPLGRVCLVAQSTQFPEDYDAIAAAVRARFPDATVLDTICDATKSRQAEIRDMAARVEAFVVVGGRQSANTMRLVKLAATLRPTFHVQTSRELEPACLAGFRTVGLTAGASTPAFVIEDVRQALERLPERDKPPA